MNRKFVTKLFAVVAGAMMSVGMVTTGTGMTATSVEACDGTTMQALRGAFDANFYASRYPDVKKAYGTNTDALWNHFMNCGITEGRMINSTFDPKAYMQAYSDVQKYCNGDYSKAYEHYFKYGMGENRNLITMAALSAMGNGWNNNNNKPATVGNPIVAKLKNNINYGDKEINIGYGLTAVLTAEQMKDANIEIRQNALGYGAYLNGNLIASTPYYGFNEAGSWYVQTIDVGVDSVSDLTGVPVRGNDVSTYYNDSWGAYTTDYHHYTNGADAALNPWATTESVDVKGGDYTPYIVSFGFGEYNPNYIETGVVTYSPVTGHIDSTETGVVSANPWAEWFK